MMHDQWEQGAAYERYMGRWSRLVAREFIGWLGAAPGSRWLDVGCGTGVLSQSILQWANPQAVIAVDASAGFLAFARAQIADKRMRFEVGDARQLPVESGSCDAVVSGLALNFIPDPSQAVREMARAVRPGVVVAAYVWDYAGEMQMLRAFWDAAIALHPEALDLDEGRRFPVCHPEALAELWQGAGLTQVETRSLDVETQFRDFEDYWAPFLGGQGPAPGWVRSLDDAERAELRASLQAQLPAADDGSITLVARAWAVRGLRSARDPAR